jgi:hypothetical protein
MDTADPAIVAAIQSYVDALNRRDLDGVRAAFHFPHVLFGAGRVVHYPAASDLSFAAFDARVAQHGWARSTWDGHRAVLAGPEKVHLDVWFTRWRADGSAIGQHHSLYIVTRVDGRWGIQARSSYG